MLTKLTEQNINDCSKDKKIRISTLYLGNICSALFYFVFTKKNVFQVLLIESESISAQRLLNLK